MAGPRQAGPAYAAAMAAIHQTAFPPHETWSAEAIGRQLALPGVAGWIDPDGGMILVRLAADELEVLTLAVAPAARRRGIGAALLEAALGWAAAHGGQAAFLEVAEGNAPARALYARAGFLPAGRRRRYYADGGDALILRCSLSRPAAGAAG